MGRTKQLLPWPPGDAAAEKSAKTVVEAAFDVIAGYCDAMVVVLGHEPEAVKAALGKRVFSCARVNPDTEMVDSIKAGLSFLLEAGQNWGAALVHPADQPQVDPNTIQTLLNEHAKHPWAAIMPEFEGRGGHPVIIPAGLFNSILTFCAHGGLRQLWIEHPHWRVRVPVNDRSVIADLDFPQDYAGSEAAR